MARDWKSIALLSIGFSAGVAYTVACGDERPLVAHADEGDSHSSPDSGEAGADDDTAETDETPPPGVTVVSRAVIEVSYVWVDNELYGCASTSSPLSDEELAEREAACCPEGFSFVGVSAPTHDNGSPREGICLED